SRHASLILLANCSDDFSRGYIAGTTKVITTIRQQYHPCVQWFADDYFHLGSSSSYSCTQGCVTASCRRTQGVARVLINPDNQTAVADISGYETITICIVDGDPHLHVVEAWSKIPPHPCPGTALNLSGLRG